MRKENRKWIHAESSGREMERKTWKRGAAILMACGLAAGALAACGGREGNETAGKASSDKAQSAGDLKTGLSGELHLFTWDGMFPAEVLEGFEQETGVRVSYSNFDYDEDMLAKLEESKGGDYDLVIADDYIIELAIEEGLAQKLDTSRLENYGNLNPVFMSQFYDPDNAYTIPYGAGIPLIVYDPSLTDVKIEGYEDLWNKNLEDNVAITANYRVIDGIALKTLGESFNTEDLDTIRKAGDKLLELAPNIRVISDSNTQDYIVSGEVAAAFLYTSQVYGALNAKPELEVVYPKEGLGFGIMASFIPSQAPNPDAAYAFLDYINRPEVAAKCYEFLGYYCTNKAAEPLISQEMQRFVVLPEGIEGGEIVQNISAEAEDLHARIWNEFKTACD